MLYIFYQDIDHIVEYIGVEQKMYKKKRLTQKTSKFSITARTFTGEGLHDFAQTEQWCGKRFHVITSYKESSGTTLHTAQDTEYP